MKISEMTIEDIESVTQLAEQLGYSNSIDELRRRFQTITNLQYYALFVAKSDDGKVIG